MRTVPNHLSSDRPRGEYEALCSVCGVRWLSSQLRRDASGRWCCPDDYKPGDDSVSLSRANAQGARSSRQRPQRQGPPPEPTKVYTPS